MPCHAVQSSLSPGILLWSLMQSHGWTTCGSKKHLQISNFQNFTFYSNIQNANAYIRTPSWIYDWRPSCESIALETVWTVRCVWKKKALVLLWAVFENALPRLLVKNDFVDFQSRWALFRNRPKAAIQPPIKYSVMLEHQLLPQTAYSSLKSCYSPFKIKLNIFPQ